MILLYSNLDTDLLAAAGARSLLPPGVSLRAARPPAEPGSLPAGTVAVVLRLLGGARSYPALPGLVAACRETGVPLVAFSAGGVADDGLAAVCTAPDDLAAAAAAYVEAGGPANLAALACRLSGAPAAPPAPLPEDGVYLDRRRPGQACAGIVFYRAHFLAGNTAFVDALADALEGVGLGPLAVFCHSLRGSGLRRLVDRYLAPAGGAGVDCLISTMSFAAGAAVADESATASAEPPDDAAAILARLDVPVLQAIPATTSRAEWEAGARGLSPVDVAMSVVMPEVDGRVITVPVSFKEPLDTATGARADTGAAGVQVAEEAPIHYVYVPAPERVAHVAAQAAAWVRLRRRPNAAKRVALLFNNYPSSNGRIGNGVGLDTAASAVAILRALRDTGYDVGEPDRLPADGDDLMRRLIAAGTWDAAFPAALPTPPPTRTGLLRARAAPPRPQLPGLRLGNVLLGIQPPRGHAADPSRIYHDPELPPPAEYVAYYRWLREGFGADAVVHLGKHGTLEWLPGKATGLSGDCWPERVLGALPNLYPFAVNNPGEGAQAKRRSHAVIVDHLPPPLAQAGTLAGHAEIERLLAACAEAALLNPAAVAAHRARLWDAVERDHLDEDLGAIRPASDAGWDALASRLEAHLADLEGAQVRDGLHVLGRVPDGEALIDLLFALTRTASGGRPSVRAAVAEALGLDAQRSPAARARVDEAVRELLRRAVAGGAVTPPLAERVPGSPASPRPLTPGPSPRDGRGEKAHGKGDIGAVSAARLSSPLVGEGPGVRVGAALAPVGDWILPALRRTGDEIGALLAGLRGGYVPAGPAGAPTRGMLHCLPTGRNFYSVDPRRLPSEAAWASGSALAEALLERHRQEAGRLPQTVGLVLWGTSNMRTQGEDVAEALALLGVRPVWVEGRVDGLEVLPLEALGRPRIDVVLRISGLFRDAFPSLVHLLDDAIARVAALDEPPEWNYVVARDAAVAPRTGNGGIRPARIFGSKPGAYGAGLLPLFHQGNWRTEADVAAVYETWGAYAYGGAAYGAEDRAAFRARFAGIEAAAKNQDNREHDIFDADDYFQYHGGMVAAARHLRRAAGADPDGVRAYVGDSSDPGQVRQRTLEEETRRVYRTRVTNPRWIAAAMRHGYRGAAEMANTVDYFFGYDATAGSGGDWMYEGIAGAYLLDPEVQRFFQEKNPWALREACERLLEAAQRGLWQAEAGTLQALTDLYLQTEADLEAGSGGRK